MRNPVRLLLVALVATAFANAIVVAGYIYASMAVSSDIGLPARVSHLVDDGWFNLQRVNERLAADGRTYRVEAQKSAGVTGAGCVGLARDYFLLPAFDLAARASAFSVVLPGIQIVLLAILGGIVVRSNRPAPKAQ